MRSAVLTFPARSGTGTQTVTGVQDPQGSFTPTFILFQSGYAAINTLTAPGFPANFYMDSRGIASGAIGAGGSGASAVLADADAGFRDVAGAGGFGYCLLDFTAQPAFGGLLQRKAYVSAVADGSFTLTYDQNDRTGDDILCTAFGGSDLGFELLTITNGVKSVSTKPQGLFVAPNNFLSGSLSAATATGGGNVSWGWDTRDGVHGASDIEVGLGGGSWSQQLTNKCCVQLDGFAVPLNSTPIVSAWNDLALTIAGNGPDVIALPGYAVCGADIRCAAGTLIQPSVTGAQTFDTGIKAKWIMFASSGFPVSAAQQNAPCQTVIGWGTPNLDQVGFWTGEDGVNVLLGARYLSDSTVLRFGTPNTTSTTFVAVAALASLASDGSASLNWTTVDSTARQILWFAIGEEAVGPIVPSFHTTRFVRRRLRRSPILWSENQGLQTQVRVNLIAVDMQPGVSTQVDTPDAQVMIRASKDGGRTWTSERFVSVGAIGAYMQRLNTWRWGQGRQWVVEVSTSDPVTYNLVNLYIDADPGTS